jgi:hypothetical protein
MKTKRKNNSRKRKKELGKKKVEGYSNRGGGKKVKYSKTTFALVY